MAITRKLAGVFVLFTSLSAATAGAQPPAQDAASGWKAVEPKVIWFNGLEQIQGTYKYLQIASPGGLWQEDTIVELESDAAGPITGAGGLRYRAKSVRKVPTQISLNELPKAERERLAAAELTISALQVPSKKSAAEMPSPGQRGKAPYHGFLRQYEETALAEVKYKGLPGIAAADPDKGEFSGKVQLELTHQSHTDPSDFGIFDERFKAEATWGAAAQTRLTAQLNATKHDGSATHVHGDSGEDQVIANARLMRGGREIFVYIDYLQVEKAPTAAGANLVERRIRGAVRLGRVAQ